MALGMSRFRRGSSTFKCQTCGRLTRETGVQSMGNENCPQCYELAGIENEISDGHTTRGERLTAIRGYVAEVAAKGGDVSEWTSTFQLGAGDEDRS